MQDEPWTIVGKTKGPRIGAGLEQASGPPSMFRAQSSRSCTFGVQRPAWFLRCGDTSFGESGDAASNRFQSTHVAVGHGTQLARCCCV